MRIRLVACMGGLAVVVGCLQGLGYQGRLANPWGSHLLAAGRGPTVARRSPARRVVLVVIDGLRADAAMGMRSVAWLEAHGTCRRTDVGPLTRSRPVYTLLSSGVEPDRSGVRTNDAKTPAPVESLWQVARRAGLHVAGVSDLSWWQELFPDGFDDYRILPTEANAFVALPGADGLVLIHHDQVDLAGHDAGASSPGYRRAVAHVDAELEPFLASLDLASDAVVVTADHGHTNRGGHGGDAPELRLVLTCAAGHGIARLPRAPGPTIDARAIPLLLATLAQIPLPRHLAVSPTDAEAVFGLVDPQVLASTIAAYRREVGARHSAVSAQLSAWLQQPNATWAGLARRQRGAQWLRLAMAMAVGVLLLVLLARWCHGGWRRAGASLGVGAVTLAGGLLAIGISRGRFDLAAINQALPFILVECVASLVVLLIAGTFHLRLWRDPPRLLFDGMVLVALELLIALAHLTAFGWPVGYPLPPPALLFLPYPLAAFTALTGAALLGMALLQSTKHAHTLGPREQVGSVAGTIGIDQGEA